MTAEHRPTGPATGPVSETIAALKRLPDLRAAIEGGTLEAARFESYHKLSAETAAATKRQELGAERFQREKGKGISRVIKDFYKKRPGGKR